MLRGFRPTVFQPSQICHEFSSPPEAGASWGKDDLSSSPLKHSLTVFQYTEDSLTVFECTKHSWTVSETTEHSWTVFDTTEHSLRCPSVPNTVELRIPYTYFSCMKHGTTMLGVLKHSLIVFRVLKDTSTMFGALEHSSTMFGALKHSSTVQLCVWYN